MEFGFDAAEWQPTKPREPGDAALSSAYISHLCNKVTKQSQDILRYPYDPNLWLRRSITLSRLRYPELAVGDAHKAKLLCQAHLSRLSDHRCWRLGHRMGFWMRDETANDPERDELLRRYLDKLHERAIGYEREPTELFVDDPEGKFKRRAYPWTPSRHRRRSDQLLATINEELTERSAIMENGAACVLKRHAFGVGAGDAHEVLGVFASRHVKNGDAVLLDPTMIWGCNGPGTYLLALKCDFISEKGRSHILTDEPAGANGDYANLYGGRGCWEPVHPNSDSDDTSLDLRWVRDLAGKHASSTIRNLKLLLCSIQDGSEHPLDHKLIARMTPNYPKDRTSKFSLNCDIAIPNQALQQFGVDIFANHNYDTWVLFTIEARARNNSCGDPTADLLCPLFSLFNHSCTPNVHWQVSKDHQSITATACKRINQDEQMFVWYDGFIEDQSLEERRRRLWWWLDGPCQCERCLLEEAAAAKDAEPSPESISSERKWDWDLEALPVFPEDYLVLKN